MKATFQAILLLGVGFSVILVLTAAKQRGVRWCPRNERQIEKVLILHICVEKKESNAVEEQYRRTLHRGRQLVKTEREANSFLRSLFKRVATGEPYRPTSLAEECCNETCHMEELKEYCKSTPRDNLLGYRYY